MVARSHVIDRARKREVAVNSLSNTEPVSVTSAVLERDSSCKPLYCVTSTPKFRNHSCYCTSRAIGGRSRPPPLHAATETNVFQFSLPGTFGDPLTEVVLSTEQAVEPEIVTLLSRHPGVVPLRRCICGDQDGEPHRRPTCSKGIGTRPRPIRCLAAFRVAKTGRLDRRPVGAMVSDWSAWRGRSVHHSGGKRRGGVSLRNSRHSNLHNEEPAEVGGLSRVSSPNGRSEGPGLLQLSLRN